MGFKVFVEENFLVESKTEI